MVEYICEKCNKLFNRKSTYTNHINKKNPCKKQIEHISNAKYESLMKNIEEIINANTLILKENNELKKNLEQTHDEFQKEIKGLKDEIKKLKQISNKTLVNGTNIGRDDNSKNIYVTINQFDKHIDNLTMKRILNKGFLVIPEQTRMIHQ
jgi:hypothetical protein